MELGLTFPLQRRLRRAVPYGRASSRLFCWDLHCISLQGRDSLLLVHSSSRYTVLVWDLSSADWSSLPELAVEHIRLGLLDSGISRETADRYLARCGSPELTRTHGRREVAFLNRAWEDAAALDWTLDKTSRHQSLLAHAVNTRLCRCAGHPDRSTALEFLHRDLARFAEL